jgi:hypothetical protein
MSDGNPLFGTTGGDEKYSSSIQLNELFIGSNSTSLIGRYCNHKSKEWCLVSTILSRAWKYILGAIHRLILPNARTRQRPWGVEGALELRGS